ncbi:DUF2993 domain-containing protein [Rubrivirga sp. IMCC45206]|uniref:LmeA family phospholipid-binding protein n=1 Tax=Rubrivirga sp. IMCC45206 TaxID=3391614 RepID=UPI00398FA33F
MRILLLLLALAASGCDVSGRVEAEIVSALPKALGPADHYDATVDGLQLSARTAERVTITGDRVAREDAPVVDRLDVTLWGVAFDQKTRVLTRVDSARATARLLPADLATYLGTQRGISRAAVTLAAPDRATVRVEGAIEGFRLPVGAEIRGQLVAADGAVRLDVESVRAAGIGLGGSLARAVGDRINPVADLRDEDLALTVTDVRVERGAVVVEATGDLQGVRLRR